MLISVNPFLKAYFTKQQLSHLTEVFFSDKAFASFKNMNDYFLFNKADDLIQTFLDEDKISIYEATVLQDEVNSFSNFLSALCKQEVKEIRNKS